MKREPTQKDIDHLANLCSKGIKLCEEEVKNLDLMIETTTKQRTLAVKRKTRYKYALSDLKKGDLKSFSQRWKDAK